MLTTKHRAFIEYYLQSWNARESAERAGYASPLKAGWRLIKHPEVNQIINERLKEMGVCAEEIVVRLAQYVRNNPSEFYVFIDEPQVDKAGVPILDDAGKQVLKRQINGVNWTTFERCGHLVKKLTYDRQGRPVLEFYDAQRALEMLGRYAKLDEVANPNSENHVEDLSALADLIADAKSQGET
jgi:hypothetical protein